MTRCAEVGRRPTRKTLASTRRWISGQRGQAAVEIVGLLPMLVAVVFGAAQLLAAGVADELADHAAEAGAVALLEGSDPERAARDALPGWARNRVAITVRDRRVSVTVRPPSPLPALAAKLSGHASADAGEGS